jgi:hypothetical protein
MRELEDYHILFLTTTQKLYYVSTLGKIGYINSIELQKNKGVMDEALIHWISPKTLVRGQKRLLSVVAGSQKFILKNLIARIFIRSYHLKEHIVEHKNGNFEDCSLKNLFLVSKHKILSLRAKTRKTNEIAVKKKGDTVWKTYRSIKEAADALFVYNDTLANYLNRRNRSSILMEYEFLVNGVKFIPRKKSGANWRIKTGIL